MKNIDEIISHFLLCHNDLLSSIDNEVSSLVIWTFTSCNYLCFCEIIQGTELALHHDRHFSYWDFFLHF